MKIKITTVVLLFMILFIMIGPLMAQSEVEGTLGEQVDTFQVFAAAGLTFLVMVIDLVIRGVFPDWVVPVNRISVIVQAGAAIMYIVAFSGGMITQLNIGADFLNTISVPLGGLLIIVYGPDSVRPENERVVVGRAQGNRWAQLE